MSFRWALGGGDSDRASAGGDAGPCGARDHGPSCGCAHRGAAVQQTLDELEFARSACALASSGDVGRLGRLLDRDPSAVGGAAGGGGATGYTPLHYAARAGRLDAARLLLSRGAEVDARTAAGRATPLHRAAHVGCLPMVELL